MDDSNAADFKLDGKFLKEIMFEMLEKPSAQEFTIKLPVLVQVENVFKRDEWNLYFLADGEFQMSRCYFVSKQSRPERFSILKVTKIAKLPKNTSIKYMGYYTVGEIEFDTEVSGEQVGFCLYKDLKDINFKEVLEKGLVVGSKKVKKIFETPKPMEIMKHMWENRSEKFCDINFTFDEGVVFAHTSVLVAASDVFKAHTDNEGFIDNKSVNIVDVSLYSFNKLLEFIYMGKVQFTSWRLAFELLYLSKKYLMSDLEKLCQSVINEFCDHDGENVLKVFEQNRKVNDTYIQKNVENNVVNKIYEVINSNSYLNCDFSTVEWIMSFYFLPLDEWSRLSAIYKWAVYNEANTFCEGTGDETDECLHALLEYVRYENIDGLSLQRFFTLSKLHEVVNVSDLKLSVFDSLLQDGSLRSHNGTNYPKYRIFGYQRCRLAEIEIGSSKEIKMRDIFLDNDGPVIGFKIKTEEKKMENGEHSIDIVASFRYLYSRDEKKDIELSFSLKAIKTKSRSVSLGDTAHVADSAKLVQGEWKVFRLLLKDSRGYLSDRLEDFGVENSGDSNKLKIISLNINITEIEEDISDISD